MSLVRLLPLILNPAVSQAPARWSHNQNQRPPPAERLHPSHPWFCHFFRWTDETVGRIMGGRIMG